MSDHAKVELETQTEEQDVSSPDYDRWNDPRGWQLVRGSVGEEGWTFVGRFDFNGHGDFWSGLPNEAGLYRLKFSETVYYVGQAKSIFRRLGDYYQPGQGVESDHRIHRALRKFDGADVQVMVGDRFLNPSVRRKRESAEIDALQHTVGIRVLNGNCVENLQNRMEYHQDQIAILKKRISELTESAKVVEK